MHGNLKETADHDGVTHIPDNFFRWQLFCQHQSGNDRDIEQCGRKCRRGEVVFILQKCRKKSDDKNQRQIGEIDRYQRSGFLDGIGRESRSDDFGEESIKKCHQCAQQKQKKKKFEKDGSREETLVAAMGEGGQKTLGKSPLREDPSEEIGEFERNDKDIGIDIRSQNRSLKHISEKAQDSGGENSDAVGENRSEHSRDCTQKELK